MEDRWGGLSIIPWPQTVVGALATIKKTETQTIQTNCFIFRKLTAVLDLLSTTINLVVGFLEVGRLYMRDIEVA